MEFNIVQKCDGKYDPDVLLPLWEDALPDLDEKKIAWAYEANPYGKANLYLCQDSQNQQFFGSGVVLPRNYYCNGREIKGGVPVDFAMRKDYRILGPALKLQKTITASENFEILICFPNQKAKSIFSRVGYRPLGNFTRFTKVFKSAPILKKRYNSSIYTLAAPIIDLFLKCKSLRIGKGQIQNYHLDFTFSEKIENLWEKAKDQFDFIGSRNVSYLLWRFSQNPYKSYKIFVVEDPASLQPVGYIIYFMKENIAHIGDFLYKGSISNMRDMFEMFISYCKKKKINAITLKMLNNEKCTQCFDQLGFIKEQTEYQVTCFQKSNIFDTNQNIFLTEGDTDSQ